MAQQLPATPVSLLFRLRNEQDQLAWQISWRRFLELYNAPLLAMASGIFRFHTGQATPPQSSLEDVVAMVVIDFFSKDRFDPNRGRLRTYLRMLTNARVVDLLRKQRPLDHISIDDEETNHRNEIPDETPEETLSFHQSLIATLIEDLRENIPLRHFQIFELVKLQGVAPDVAAEELGVSRGVIDNTVYKVMVRLREIATRPEYQCEYYQ